MLSNLAFIVGATAIAIIVWGVFLGTIQLLRYESLRLRSRVVNLNLNEIRHIVASYLLLGLEILIAADIIRTVVEPSLGELAIVGGLVVIRTVISFFLGREIGESRPAPHERLSEKPTPE